MGWLPDYPSFRDYTPQSTKVANMFKKVDLDETLRFHSPQEKIYESGVLQQKIRDLQDHVPQMLLLGWLNILKEGHMENTQMPQDYFSTK